MAVWRAGVAPAEWKDAQHGFRSGRGTANCPFNLRRLLEPEFMLHQHAAFVDFSKASDPVNHEVL